MELRIIETKTPPKIDVRCFVTYSNRKEMMHIHSNNQSKIWNKNKGLDLEKITLKSFKVAQKVLKQGFNKLIKKAIFVKLFLFLPEKYAIDEL